MAYTSFTHCTVNEYEEIIYSQDDRNRARIWFNNVELQDVGIKCEKITRKSRILPDDGKKIFSLSNFIATEIEVVLHNVDLQDIVDQVKISIGTLVSSSSLGDTYEDVPLGIFNIQNTPVVNDNKVTLKLRDNRVKFDFGYNAKTLIDNNYVLTTDTTYQASTLYYVFVQSVDSYVQLIEGTDYNVGDAIVGDVYNKKNTVTKMQILNDICLQAGVVNTVTSFEFDDDEIGIYDDSINASNYVYYLAEQCGCIPIINRLGELEFLDLTNLYTWRIPRSILPSPYTLGTPYQIERVVYEQGITKYESSPNETLDTLFLDSSNPYIDRQEQIDYIYNLLDGFTIDTATTQKMLGNPAIDPYDLIEVYDDRDVSEPTIFKTLANQLYTFNGKHGQQFTTEIGKEQRTENVKKNSEATFKKWAKTTIDNVNAEVTIQTGKITTLDTDLKALDNKEQMAYQDLLNEFNNYAPLSSIETLETSVTQLQTDTYTKTQIQEIANGTGVDGVTVSAVISTEAQFDSDGMHYSKTDAPTSSTINYKGLEVDDTHGQEIMFAGYDEDPTSLTYGTSIVRTDNLNVTTYLQCANNKGRFEEYTDSNNNTGVGFFLT